MLLYAKHRIAVHDASSATQPAQSQEDMEHASTHQERDQNCEQATKDAEEESGYPSHPSPAGPNGLSG